jgi:zinc/manganese transport system permease protein
MNQTIQLLIWPILACLLLPGILVYYGLHIVRRGVIFVDLALAQVATLGTCFCLQLGHEPNDPHNYFWSLGFTLVGALVFTFTRPTHRTRVPQEALIGIVYVVAAATGILLLSQSPHGKEELQRTLVGDLLTVGWNDVWKTAALYAVIGVVHYLFRKRFIALSFEHGHTGMSRLSVHLWDFLFYALFGLVVTSFVQIGGVLLVFSYLIVPAVCANYLLNSLRVMLVFGWIIATACGIGGIALATKKDLPIGASIVCVLGAALLLCVLLIKFRLISTADSRDPITKPPAKNN